VHRSAIVRRDAVQEIRPLTHGDFEVILTTGAVVRGSRSRRAALAMLTAS
jgi:DNA-binding LytR/AlgR family response regulator